MSGRQNSQREMTTNEAISANAQLSKLIATIDRESDQIAAMLAPQKITFEAFRQVVVAALRKNAKLLACNPTSVVSACLDAARDGLLPDGREAVIIDRNINVGTSRNPQWAKHATYQPMAYGIRKKIISSGAARMMETTIVYANEEFRVIRGTNPHIEHEVISTDDARGAAIGCYSVAMIEPGLISFEYMTAGQIGEIRKLAETQKVWEAHELEMWRKTVLRRHAKALPGRPFVDVEAEKLFPQFQAAEHPQLEAPRSRPRAPQRDDYLLADETENLSGQRLEDIDRDDGRETIDADTGEVRNQVDSKRAGRKAGAKAKPAEKPSLPKDEGDWDLWVSDFRSELGARASIVDINSLRSSAKAHFDAMPAHWRDELESEITNRKAEIASQPRTDTGADADVQEPDDGAIE